MQKRIKVNCGKCATRFIIPLSELDLHISIDGETVMCPKCCRDEYWFEPDRCNKCSEKTMCKGLFLSNMKNSLKGIDGI